MALCLPRLAPLLQVANPSIGARRCGDACRDSLRRLRVSALELYLVHSPFVAGVPLLDTWRECEALVDAGLVRNLGVSNFRVADLRTLLAGARIRPSVNQIEARSFARDDAPAVLCADAVALGSADASVSRADAVCSPCRDSTTRTCSSASWLPSARQRASC
jgi:hypothetical protein